MVNFRRCRAKAVTSDYRQCLKVALKDSLFCSTHHPMFVKNKKSIKFYHNGVLISDNENTHTECSFIIKKSEKRVIDGKMVRVIQEAELIEASIVSNKNGE